MHGSRCAALGLAIVLVSALGAQADPIIIQHVGDTDPVNEGWASTVDGGNWAGAVDDSGIPAWQTSDTSTSNGYCYYDHFPDPTDFTDPTGWTVTARMRVVWNHCDQLGSDAGFGVADGTSYWYFDMVGDEDDPDPDSDGIWLDTNSGTKTRLHPMDTAAAYHTYQLVYDPAQSGQASVYVDGTWIADLSRSQVAPAPVHPWTYYLYFGAGTRASTGVSNYNYVAFETGQQIIPEPLSMAFLGSAFVGVVAWRVRRRRRERD